MGVSYYTLILSDPDALWLLMDEYVHWVVMNIPGDQVSRGTTVLPYLGPAPAKGSGMHRYVFSLYRQTTQFAGSQIDQCARFFKVRQGIRTHGFMTSLQNERGINMVDSTPVGLEAFMSEWTEGVDELPHAVLMAPGEMTLSGSSKNRKKTKLSKQMRFYTDRIMSMIDLRSSFSMSGSDENKLRDSGKTSNADDQIDRLIRSNIHNPNETLKKRHLSFDS
eukprot:gene39117-47508_t